MWIVYAYHNYFALWLVQYIHNYKNLGVIYNFLFASRIYEERSVYLQSKLYEENAGLAMELVVTEYTVWDITISPLECAHENMMLDFISHSCCQRRLNKIWYNDIGGSLKGVLKVS